ncbi:MAG: PAM68 family protein [Cyanobacteria bacterium P01_C01_bin.89]
MAEDSSQSKGFKGGDRLPFEPNKSGKAKKAKAKAKSQKSGTAKDKAESKKPIPRKLNPITTFKKKDKDDKSDAKGRTKKAGFKGDGKRGRTYTREEMAIPKVVSDRMLKRMLVFSGVPTAIGFGSFIAGYFINVNTDIELPNVVVLLTSLGGLGLGVIGLSYGLLSTSWDENDKGSALGVSEAKVNFGRLADAWKASRSQGGS